MASKTRSTGKVKAFEIKEGIHCPTSIEIEVDPESNEGGDRGDGPSSSESIHHRCVICNRQYKHTSALNFHIRTIHREEVIDPRSNHPTVMCPICDKECLRRSSMVKHLKEEHDVHCTTEEHMFQDWQSEYISDKNAKLLKISTIVLQVLLTGRSTLRSRRKLTSLRELTRKTTKHIIIISVIVQDIMSQGLNLRVESGEAKIRRGSEVFVLQRFVRLSLLKDSSKLSTAGLMLVINWTQSISSCLRLSKTLSSKS